MTRPRWVEIMQDEQAREIAPTSTTRTTHRTGFRDYLNNIIERTT